MKESRYPVARKQDFPARQEAVARNFSLAMRPYLDAGRWINFRGINLVLI
jgi:hypothetical protein